jgi:hypothetical protein
VAFHLHRLKLVGRALHQAGYHKTDAADLAAARSGLSEARVTALATRLGVGTAELARELSPDEQRQWAFYRACAADPQHVWAAARTAWAERGLQDKDAAALLGFSPKRLSKALAIGRPLQFEAAARLTTALNVPGGPEALLPSPKSNDQQPSR